MSILIRGGTVVNHDWMQPADVLIENGKIKAIGKDLAISSEVDRIIDATGKYVMPGGIDPHTHLEAEFMGAVTVDDFYIGSRAALAGGTTMFIDFVFPSDKLSPMDAYQEMRKKADPKVCCDYAISVCVNRFDESIAEQMTKFVQPEYGVNSFKFFLAYPNFMVSDVGLYQAMRHCAKIGALARVHAENGPLIIEKQKELLSKGITGPEGHPQSRPEEVEAEATNRACMIAHQANCPLYVVHVMSKGAATCVAAHKKSGAVVIGEALAVGLAKDGSAYYSKDWRHAAAHVMSPPISCDPTTPDKLMQRLACDELSLTGTDNCTYSTKQKELGRHDFTKIPNGVNGIEDRMSLVWEKGVQSGKMDAMRFVAVTSSTAAKIFNIYPRKGRIATGSDADVVVWNPKATRVISAKTHHHACDVNIFEGMKVHGVCEVTISRGKVVWENNRLDVPKGTGKFIALPPYSPYCYAKIPQRAQVFAQRKVTRNPEVDIDDSALGLADHWIEKTKEVNLPDDREFIIS